MKLERPGNQAEEGACELQSKIRTNDPARTRKHASVNFAVINNSPVRQIPSQPTQAAVQVLGGVASGLAWVGSRFVDRGIDSRCVGENRRLAGNVNAIPWHLRKFYEFGLVRARWPQS